MKKVLILSASPRKNGNSDILCQQFKKGQKKPDMKLNKFICMAKRSDFVMLVMLASKQESV